MNLESSRVHRYEHYSSFSLCYFCLCFFCLLLHNNATSCAHFLVESKALLAFVNISDCGTEEKKRGGAGGGVD